MNSAQHIWVEVHDIKGAKIQTLMDGDLPGGYYEVKWRGDNVNGNKEQRRVFTFTR
ncbi:MAG: hypothetical protein R2750_07645 [Bacteroidales bacterium]